MSSLLQCYMPRSLMLGVRRRVAQRFPRSVGTGDNLRGGTVVKQVKRETKIERPRREIVDRETALKRIKAFPSRRKKLIAAIKDAPR